ncbi:MULTISPECIES: S-layer homology domain-containing protein [unclassified Lysinibacillus]|uniref:S-layer homology domain-containing protein n=1 Tax=unclassified Lysinibacillus TaxID=2636778 RepID=UPI00381BF9A9
MKKWILLIIFFGILLIGGKAEAASEGYDMKNAPFWPANTWIEKVPDYSYDYYRLQLNEDSLVTFTFDDPIKASVLIALIQDNGTELGRDFAYVRTTKDDGDENKTVQQLQLHAGLYYVRIDGPDGPDGQPYNATYTLAPLHSSFDVEPNNTSQQANPIALNKPIKSVGTVGAFEDYYTFTLDKTSKVTLQTEEFKPQVQGYRPNLYININDVNGYRYLETMTSRDLSKSATEVLPPGTYTVKVDASETEYNPAYQFTVKTETIIEPETFKNSIFGTTLTAGQKIRGFLGRNDNYYFTLDRKQKVEITVTTDSQELMSAILQKANATGEYQQIYDYEYDFVQQQAGFTITAILQAGKYNIETSTLWSQQDEVNYTIQFDEVTYRDVPPTYRYYNEIMNLSTMGIIQGYSDGLFKPTDSISRRHVFTMLSRYSDINLTPIREMKQFEDLRRFSLDYELVLPFYRAGIVDGSNGKMNISSNLTRAQLAKILVNTFDLKMQDTAQEFKDVSSKHDAYEYIRILASNGISTGSNGYFMPNAPVSREHFSVFLYRLFENMKE